MSNDEINNVDLEALKEQAFRDGWEEGFQYACSLMNKPISMPDAEVINKITGVEAFLLSLEW